MSSSASTQGSLTKIARVQHVVNPTKEQLDQAANVIATSFAVDPLTKMVTGGDLCLSFPLFRAWISAIAIGGELHVLTLSSQADGETNPVISPSDIIAVAGWFPPGTSLNTTAEQRAAGWDQFIDSIPQTLRDWWLNYFIPSMTQFSIATLGEGYQLNNWTLYLIGVLPEYQGKGLGKSLYKFGESKAKQSNSDISLETSTEADVIIYKKLGFELRGEIPLESDIGKNRMVLMTKKAEDLQ